MSDTDEKMISAPVKAMARKICITNGNDPDALQDGGVGGIAWWWFYVDDAMDAVQSLSENITDSMIEALQAEARFRLIGEETNADYHRRAIKAAILASLEPSAKP